MDSIAGSQRITVENAAEKQSAPGLNIGKAGGEIRGTFHGKARNKALPPEAQEKISKLEHIATLWKYRPIPPEPERDRSQEVRHHALSCGAVTLLGANVRGRKHVHSGTDCDDWFTFDGWDEEGAVFIAVSDGAGSRKFSRVGARVSCETAVDSLRRNLTWLVERDPALRKAMHAPAGSKAYSETFRAQLPDLMTDALKSARDGMYQAFMDRVGTAGYESLRGYRDLSATMLLALLIPLDNGEYLIASCQVGDGGLALFDAQAPYEKALTILGSPDSGEFAGETEFLTSASMSQSGNLRQRVEVRQARFDTLLLMTDGVADDYFPANPEFFRLYFDLTANGILPVIRNPSGADSCPAGENAGETAAEDHSDTVPAGEAGSGSVPAGEAGSGSVLAAEAGSGSAPAGEAGSGSVPAGEAGSGSVPAGEAGSGSVPAAEAGSGSVPAGEAGSGSVLAGEAGSGSVLAAEAGSSSVLAAEAGSGTVPAGENRLGTVPSAEDGSDGGALDAAAPDTEDCPFGPLSFPDAVPEGQSPETAEVQQRIPINYTWLLQAGLGLTLKDLWNNPSILERVLHRIPENAAPAEERLELWLKHYVETTSFDDRTLVVVRTDRGGQRHADSKPV